MAITSVRTSSISNPQRFQSLAQATYVAPVPSTIGMVLINPTSIAYAGTSATKGANGQVTFTAVTSLSLNGVFSADFDNYVVSIRSVGSSSDSIRCRLRVSGSDASGTNYTVQNLVANGSTVSASRETSQTNANFGSTYSTQRDGMNVAIYGPFLTQPTAFRGVTVGSLSSAIIVDRASTHSLSTSYDGFTAYLDSENMTGALQVYGVRS